MLHKGIVNGQSIILDDNVPPTSRVFSIKSGDVPLCIALASSVVVTRSTDSLAGTL